MPTIQLDETESRTLLAIHTFEQAMCGATAPCQQIFSTGVPGWENSVPKYLIYAVVQDKLGVSHLIETPVDRAFHSLEKLGLIEHSPPKFGKLLTGQWTLPDGRTIETRGECGEHPRGGPSWALDVFIDGTRAFGLSGPPDMTFPQFDCYRLTKKGLVVVRGQAELAGDKKGYRKVRQPAWERLKLQHSADGSDGTANLDGKKTRIRGDAAFKFLDSLQKKNGKRVKAAVLQSEIGQRPDRVYELLNRRLQCIIDKPGQGGTGYAML